MFQKVSLSMIWTQLKTSLDPQHVGWYINGILEFGHFYVPLKNWRLQNGESLSQPWQLSPSDFVNLLFTPRQLLKYNLQLKPNIDKVRVVKHGRTDCTWLGTKPPGCFHSVFSTIYQHVLSTLGVRALTRHVTQHMQAGYRSPKRLT